jgi:hypothetical protein
MQELTTTATLVEYATFEDSEPIGAVLARSELEAALEAEESVALWFEFGSVRDEETRRLTLELSSGDVEEMLRLSPRDELIVALDPDAVAGFLADPDVEAHGMRGALAIAVVTAAIAAPAGLAASPQTADAAATAQRASLAATAQSARVKYGARAGLAATAQVSNVAAKTQVSKSLVFKAAGVRFLRDGLSR